MRLVLTVAAALLLACSGDPLEPGATCEGDGWACPNGGSTLAVCEFGLIAHYPCPGGCGPAPGPIGAQQIQCSFVGVEEGDACPRGLSESIMVCGGDRQLRCMSQRWRAFDCPDGGACVHSFETGPNPVCQ